MIKVLITGDFCPNNLQEFFERKDYSKLYNNFLPCIKEADIAITNLECPITASNEKLEKTGPNLKGTKDVVKALKDGGFNLITLANNHIKDFGDEGLKSTILELTDAGIDHVGVGMNIEEARKPFYVKVNELNLVIMNFCENEWSTTFNSKPGANPLSLINNYNDIKNAKNSGNHVIVIVHGGHEHFNLPSPRIKEMFRFFVDAGASIVVGHHTHCFSGYEIYKDKPIFYSLGNFIFNLPKQEDFWYEGLAVLFSLGKDECGFKLYPVIQDNKMPGVRLMDTTEEQKFIEKLNEINEIISNDEKLNLAFKEFADLYKKSYLSVLEPYKNRILLSLYHRGILPSFLNTKKKNRILNLIRCESHRDLLINALVNV